MHHKTIVEKIINRNLSPQGRIILAAEPIFNDLNHQLPWGWGVRLDGESFRAMRKWGWLELGFTESYLRNLFGGMNLSYSRRTCPDSRWADVISLKRNHE